ncbi:MAG: PAS domain S-box protein [Candidatus Eisenbacteria bacterium]
MTQRTKLLLYLGAVHALFLGSAWVFLQSHRLWLLAVELGFAVSFAIGWRLVDRFAQPGRVLDTALELLEAEDFTTRFREAHHPEVDRLIRLYNRMVDHLRQERVGNQEQDSLLRRLIAISPSGIIALDYDGRVTDINPGACAILGCTAEDAVGRPWPEVAASLLPGGGLPEVGEDRLLTLAGRRRVRYRKLTFLDRGFPRSFLILDEMTRELREIEKAAYEKLIRTMSHEVNNTGGAVISILHSCLAYARHLPPGDRADFESGLDVATSRTRNLGDFMKSFAELVRLPPPRPEPHDLAALVGGVVRLLEPERERRRIRCRCSLDPRLSAVRVDAAQMEQVLLNVLRNAFEAIDADGEVAIVSGPTAHGAYLLIEDTGGGIPAAVEPALFTSFFTTKPGGRDWD